MSVLTINELKARFSAADRPSQKDFSDFVDTVVSMINTAVTPVSPGTAFLYAPSVLTTDTYAAVYSPAVASYVDGAVLAFKADAINPDGGTKFNAGAGAVLIVKEGFIALNAGDIQPNQIVEVRYNASISKWQLTSLTYHPGHRTGDIIPSATPLAEDGTRFLCNGQSVDTNTFPTLTILSTTYGTPSPNDGHHVKLPDYRAKFPVGIGTLPSTAVIAFGDIGGEEKHLLTAAESGLPAHTHDLTSFTMVAGSNFGPTGNNDRGGGMTDGVTGGTQSAAQSHNTLPPYIACYYYILT